MFYHSVRYKTRLTLNIIVPTLTNCVTVSHNKRACVYSKREKVMASLNPERLEVCTNIVHALGTPDSSWWSQAFPWPGEIWEPCWSWITHKGTISNSLWLHRKLLFKKNGQPDIICRGRNFKNNWIWGRDVMVHIFSVFNVFHPEFLL